MPTTTKRKPTAAEFAEAMRRPVRQCETCVWLRRTPDAARWLRDLDSIIKAGRYRGTTSQIRDHLATHYGFPLSDGAFGSHVRSGHAA